MRRMGTTTRLRRSPKLTKSNQDATHLTRVTMRRMVTRKKVIGSTIKANTATTINQSRADCKFIPIFSAMAQDTVLGFIAQGLAMK